MGASRESGLPGDLLGIRAAAIPICTIISWLRVIAELGPDGLVIGGKSMGGRIASLIADEAKSVGLVCLGYPFYPVDNEPFGSTSLHRHSSHRKGALHLLFRVPVNPRES